ncbi:MAG: CoA transferase subunit A [Chloroflexi bacterium]|nr:CoA transferase subunit A [Chloroflexota bacterium]
MPDAVAAFIPDGASVALGLALESLIPFAAGHEIIRQRKQGLTLIGPISDILFDQLIGAGCVSRVIAAWVGNVSAGLAHNYRRALEGDKPSLVVEDHSNFSIALALRAGAMGVPYLPTRSLLGSDLLRSNPHFRIIHDDGVPLVRVPALAPAVAIVHTQRADDQGGAHCWGNLGISEDAALAARQVIVIAEEIVPSSVIRSDPNRVLLPAFKVCAVVHEPGGAHPSPVQGHYGRDHAMYHDYHQASRTAEGFARWQSEWIDSVSGRQAYLSRLGAGRWADLSRPATRTPRLAAAVDYGY